MRIRVSIAACGAFLFFAGPALAAPQSSSPKMGMLNVQRVVLESKGGKEARATFESAVKERQEKLIKKDAEVKALDGSLKSLSDPAARKNAEAKLAQEVKELKRLKQDLEDELKKKDKDISSGIMRQIYAAARSYGEDQKFTMIVQMTPQTIYYDKTIDVTDEVLKRYDSTYGKK